MGNPCESVFRLDGDNRYDRAENDFAGEVSHIFLNRLSESDDSSLTPRRVSNKVKTVYLCVRIATIEKFARRLRYRLPMIPAKMAGP